MSKKKLSPKQGKKLPNQHLARLAEDDYVDPAEAQEFSDSDILAPQGVGIRSSDNESREEGALRTMARAEEEEAREDKSARRLDSGG